jgi:hypothetical protein
MNFVKLIALCALISGCTAYKVGSNDVINADTVFVLPDEVKIKIEHSEGRTEDWLVKALAKNNLAKNIVASSSPDNSAYILNLRRHFTGKCFSEPMLTAITLGIIPSIGCSEIGYSIQLTDSNGKEIARTETSSEVKSIFGLASWFLMLSPSWGGEKALTNYEAELIVNKLSDRNEDAK